MCRNITELRGLEPPASRTEIEAAAMQFVRKVSGLSRPTGTALESLRAAAVEIATVTQGLLDVLPPRRQPPPTVPPLRLPQVRAKMAAAKAGGDGGTGRRPW